MLVFFALLLVNPVLIHFNSRSAMSITLHRFTTTLSVLTLSSIALLLAQSAQAELIIHTSKDDSGRTSMVVNQDKQKELPPAQLGITPSRIDETVSLTQNKNKAKAVWKSTKNSYVLKFKKQIQQVLAYNWRIKSPSPPSPPPATKRNITTTTTYCYCYYISTAPSQK